MSRISLIVTTLLLLTAAAFAQPSTLSGLVVTGDPANQTPVAGATITLESRHGGDFTATSDEAGQFMIEGLELGMYQLEAEAEGFEDTHMPVMIIPGPNEVLVHLRPTAPQGTGNVVGTVTTEDGAVVAGAHVVVDCFRDGHGGHGFHADTETNEAGEFSFDGVPAGPAGVTAMMMGVGADNQLIEVLVDQTVTVQLVLHGRDHGGGNHDSSGHHELTAIDLEGVAIVTTDDSTGRVHYFIDTDADGVADYRLSFGPPDYDPDGAGQGAERPANGDNITVHGGLLAFGEPPMVVVWEINGLFWRDPARGHGGRHHGRGCGEPDSVLNVEYIGWAIVTTHGDSLHSRTRYALNVDDDGDAEYILDFGAPDYDPGNGATRPADGDSIYIVGGEWTCVRAPLPIVIVYEINGMYWRSPGDTLLLNEPDDALAADEPIVIGSPREFLMATNYPNPFNPSTNIVYSIPANGNVMLRVFDVTGREIETLVNTNQIAGTYTVTWDAANVPSGIYFYRVEVNGLQFTNRMVLLK